MLLASTTHFGFPLYKKDPYGQPIIGKPYRNKRQMAKDPIQVVPMLNTILSGSTDLMKAIYNSTIYLVNKPSDEDEELYAKEALKERCLIDANWAISSFNLSDHHNGYKMGNGKIKEIKNETLHILGDKDIMVPEYMLEQNKSGIKNSTVIRYNNCGHSPFVDVPDQVTKDILDFIK